MGYVFLINEDRFFFPGFFAKKNLGGHFTVTGHVRMIYNQTSSAVSNWLRDPQRINLKLFGPTCCVAHTLPGEGRYIDPRLKKKHKEVDPRNERVNKKQEERNNILSKRIATHPEFSHT